MSSWGSRRSVESRSLLLLGHELTNSRAQKTGEHQACCPWEWLYMEGEAAEVEVWTLNNTDDTGHKHIYCASLSVCFCKNKQINKRRRLGQKIKLICNNFKSLIWCDHQYIYKQLASHKIPVFDFDVAMWQTGHVEANTGILCAKTHLGSKHTWDHLQHRQG